MVIPDDKFACEVVARFIGGLGYSGEMELVTAVDAPDEFERERPAPDLRVLVEGDRYVLEHTHIESYRGEITEQHGFHRLVALAKQLEAYVEEGGRYRLAIPTGALLDLSGRAWRRIASRILEWARAVAPTLTTPDQAWRLDVPREVVEDVPFEVWCAKASRGPTGVVPCRMDLRSPEALVEVLEHAFRDKIPKLMDWTEPGDRSVLVLTFDAWTVLSFAAIVEAIETVADSWAGQLPDWIVVVETAERTWEVLVARREGDEGVLGRAEMRMSDILDLITLEP